MRKIQFYNGKTSSLLLLSSMLLLTGCGDASISAVKDSYTSSADITVSQFLDNRKLCRSVEWESFTDNYDRNIVEYQCELEGSDDYLNIKKYEVLDGAIEKALKERDFFLSRIDRRRKDIEGFNEKIDALKADRSNLEDESLEGALKFQTGLSSLSKTASMEEFRAMLKDVEDPGYMYNGADIPGLEMVLNIVLRPHLYSISYTDGRRLPEDIILEYTTWMNDLDKHKLEVEESISKAYEREIASYIGMYSKKIEEQNYYIEDDQKLARGKEEWAAELEEKKTPIYSSGHYLSDILQWVVNPDGDVILNSAGVVAKKSGVEDFHLFDYSTESDMYRKMFKNDELAVHDYIKASNYRPYR